jgi:hypothetical protein
MRGESGKRSASRRHGWRAMSRRCERAPRSQAPDGAKADGRGFGIGSMEASWVWRAWSRFWPFTDPALHHGKLRSLKRTRCRETSVPKPMRLRLGL